MNTTATHCTIVRLDLADSTAADNGDVTTEIDIFEMVPMKKGASKFNPAEFAADLIARFEEERARGVEPPFILGHAKKPNGEPDDGVPAVGWIEALSVVGKRIRAKVRLLAEFAERVKKGEFRYVSPEFGFSVDQKTGETRSAKLFRVAVTTSPFQRGADGQPVGTLQLTEMADPAEPKEIGMTPEEIKELVGETVDAKLSETNETIANLSEQVNGLTGEDGIQAKLAELSEAVAALRETPKTDESEQLSESQAAVAKMREDLDVQMVALSSELKTAKEELSALRDKDRQREALSILEAAVDSGRVLPAELPDSWKSDSVAALTGADGLGYATVEVARKALQKRHSVAPPTARTGADADATGSAMNLSDDEAIRIFGSVERAREAFKTAEKHMAASVD